MFSQGLLYSLFLYQQNCEVLNSDVVKLPDGLWSLEKISHKGKAVSTNLACIKNKSSLHKYFVLHLTIIIQKKAKILSNQLN